MPTHRYAVGAQVLLEGDAMSVSAPGRYVVEAQIPPVGTSQQYRIKSEAEGFRRIVVEHRLRPLDADPAPPAAAVRRPHPGEAD